jgi:hypothetical protein
MPADEPDLTRADIRVPEHVVARELGGQTVVLNLRTGRYHGLNATGGAMLASLREQGSIETAATQVAVRFHAPREQVLGDLVELCQELHRRGLIEIDAGR